MDAALEMNRRLEGTGPVFVVACLVQWWSAYAARGTSGSVRINDLLKWCCAFHVGGLAARKSEGGRRKEPTPLFRVKRELFDWVSSRAGVGWAPGEEP